MSRAGEEMILELAKLMGTNTVKTAAKKDDKDEKKDKKEEKEEKAEKKEKKEKDDKKEKKEDKKASVMMNVINNLVKLADELDEAGADEASSLVDDALRVIVKNLEKKKIAEEVAPGSEKTPEMPESFEGAPWREELPTEEEPEYGAIAEEAQGEADADEELHMLWEQFSKQVGPEKAEQLEEWLMKKDKSFEE